MHTGAGACLTFMTPEQPATHVAPRFSLLAPPRQVSALQLSLEMMEVLSFTTEEFYFWMERPHWSDQFRPTALAFWLLTLHSEDA